MMTNTNCLLFIDDYGKMVCTKTGYILLCSRETEEPVAYVMEHDCVDLVSKMYLHELYHIRDVSKVEALSAVAFDICPLVTGDDLGIISIGFFDDDGYAMFFVKDVVKEIL
jgi:hypothetical protein